MAIDKNVRKKIPNEAVPVAYSLAKEVYLDNITFTEGTRRLVKDYKLNPHSAADYITNFRCMRDGQIFKRTNNAFSLNYFLENIQKDFGNSGLKNALHAFSLHIPYYETSGKKKVNAVQMREIHRYFSLKLNLNLDEIEQSEIESQLLGGKKDKNKVIAELLAVKQSDAETVIINHVTYKRDNATVAKIKYVRDFQCQICAGFVLMKNGSRYVEAAHITPKHEKGCETPSNILVLCPNHHKEFDLGDYEKLERSETSIKFLLNGMEYTISLDFS